MIKVENAEMGPNRARPIRFGKVTSASPRAFHLMGEGRMRFPGLRGDHQVRSSSGCGIL